MSHLCYCLYLPCSCPSTTTAILAAVLPWTKPDPAWFGSQPVAGPLAKGSFSYSHLPLRPQSSIRRTKLSEFHQVDMAKPRQFIPTSENGQDCIRTGEENSMGLQAGLLYTNIWPTTCDISKRVVSTKPHLKLVNFSLLCMAPDGWMLAIQQHLLGHYLSCSEYPK